MNDEQTLSYVKATAHALALPLDEAQALRVAGHLARTALMAQMLEQFDLAPEVEIPEVYRPKQPVAPVNQGL